MSKRVFRVRYQLKWSDMREWANDESSTVLASDAERAIVAARKNQLGMVIEPDEEQPKGSKVVGFRLLGVEPVVSVDVLA